MAGEDYIGMEKEATFDTYAAPTEWINAIDESLSGEHQTAPTPGMYYSSARDEGRGRTLFNGGWRADLTETNIGHLFRAMLGVPVSIQPAVGTDPTVWEHLFRPQNGLGRNAETLAAVVSRSFNLAEFQATGYSPSSLSFEGVLDQDIRYTTEGPYNDEALIDPPVETPAISTIAPYNHHDSKFKLGASPVEQVRVEAWSLEITADTTMVGSIGSIKGRRAHRSAFSITGRIDEDFDDLARYQQFYGSASATGPEKTLTAQNVEISITGRTLPGTTSFLSEVLFKLPKIKFFSTEANQSERDRITQGTPFTALFDTVTGYELEVLLRGEEADTVFEA